MNSWVMASCRFCCCVLIFYTHLNKLVMDDWLVTSLDIAVTFCVFYKLAKYTLQHSAWFIVLVHDHPFVEVTLDDL